ncbi:MAG: alpha-2-macroglobulin, partial [Prevotella sp.]|nr:alpha-2-macroglobulin [Prevotella sp.]
MKLKFAISLIVLMLMPTILWANGYDTMWKRVEQAEEKDLPKTQMEELAKIVKRAQSKGDYGHLLKAQLMYSGLEVMLTPDSAGNAFRKLEDMAVKLEKKDKVGAAVYWAVLGKLFEENHRVLAPTVPREEASARSRMYYEKAISDPALLASKKAGILKPAIKKGDDSYIFGDDLLSVVCLMFDDYKTMSEWYNAHGPRIAAMYSTFKLMDDTYSYSRKFEGNEYIHVLDSLIERYGDLPECGMVGLERYECIKRCTDLTQDQKIAFMDETIERWKHWPGIAELKNERTREINPEFSIYTKNDLQLPGKTTTVEVASVRNIHQLNIRINRVDLKEPQIYSIHTEKQLAKIKSSIVKGSQQTVTRNYDLPNEFAFLKDTFQLPVLDPGVYLLEFATDDDTIEPQYNLYHVSDVFLLREDLPNHKCRFVVVSATTGHPLPNANVVLYYDKSRAGNMLSDTLRCNSEGEVVSAIRTDRTLMAYWAYTEKDRFMPAISHSTGNYYRAGESDDETIKSVEIFTDRSIYRPGQNVHVSLLAFSTRQGWTTKVSPNAHLTLKLVDANYKDVKTVELTTDEFGAAEADFTLPSNGLTGRFMLRVMSPQTIHYLRVEEYKRPTFEVEFEEYKERYEAGQTIQVKGHARSYAGVPVQGAKVKYTIKRGLSWWYWWRGRDDGEVIKQGEVETSDDGSFVVDMPLLLPENDNSIYSFTANAEVIDQGGETHEAEISIPIGRKPTSFFCNIPDKSEKEKLKTITFGLKNAAGQDIDGEVLYTIDDGPQRKANANKPVDIMASKLTSGRHVLKATCGEDTLREEFIVFSLDDERPCVETSDWFYQTESEFPRDEKAAPVAVQLGTSDADTYVLYSIMAGSKVLESGHFTLDNAVKTFRYKYKDEYESGLLLAYAWVKEGKVYKHVTKIKRPEPDKRLLMEWTTFRDKLKPGQKE